MNEAAGPHEEEILESHRYRVDSINQDGTMTITVVDDPENTGISVPMSMGTFLARAGEDEAAELRVGAEIEWSTTGGQSPHEILHVVHPSGVNATEAGIGAIEDFLKTQ